MEKSENKKNNNKLVVVLLVIIVCLVVAGSFAFYKLMSKTPDYNLCGSDNSNGQLTGDFVDGNSFPEWASYILKQNITEITYEPGTLDNNEKCINKTMTKEQLTDVLTRMTAVPLKKVLSGGGGGPCDAGINIMVGKNKYQILEGNTISKYGMDEQGLSLIEKEKYTLDDKGLSEAHHDWYYIYEWDTSYLDKMLGLKK